MFFDKYRTKLGVCVLSLLCLSVFAKERLSLPINAPLSMATAITIAQQNDPWLSGNTHKQRAIELMSTASNTLPDPKVTISLANLPTNGFDFGQEGMTQAKVGIAQVFPRGQTLAIKSEQLRLQSEAFPHQRKNREAQVAVTVGSLWLDAYRVEQSIALIKTNSALFEQLLDIAQASYSSTLGKTRQQDIISAQVELTHIEDRLALLAQQKNRFEGMLLQWLTQLSIDHNNEESSSSYSEHSFPSIHNIMLSQQLPQIALLNTYLVQSNKWLKPGALVPYFSNHPAVIAIDKQVIATKKNIDLAQQKYKPEWGVSASYGYRANDPMGNSRADLFSVGLTFDLPIFTDNKQDKEVQSAISNSEAVKTEKLLLLRQLLGAYSSAKGRLLRLNDRQHLYKLKLLPQLHVQAEATLTAYTNDDGDFAEVVRARIAVLNAEIDELTLDVEKQKLHLELNYLFVGSIQTKTIMTKNPLFQSKQTLAILGDNE